MASLIEPDLSFFQSIPWCSELLSEPDIVITTTPSRNYKSSTEDALFAETLKTPDAIGACLSFHKRPANDKARIDEVYTLLSLGYKVNGYANILHGGMVGVLLDETMGILLHHNIKTGRIPGEGAVTANLNITFLKPVATPQVILATAKIREVQGRKRYLDTTLKDQFGVVLAKAEALWVDVRGLKL
jgi:acyl-coenzyme A thioesterase PaaI-like protein